MERKRVRGLLAVLAVALMTLGVVFGASTTAYAGLAPETWNEDKTFDSETEAERIEVPVRVENDITVTIAEGKTVFVTKGIDASGHTLTVTGKGMLVVTGVNGLEGAGSENGGKGAPAIAGDVIVDGGATLQCTGGAGGKGGDGYDATPGSGGNGGAGLDGDLTIKGGKAKLAGGMGGGMGLHYSDDTEGPAAGKQGVAVTGEITAPVIQVSDDDKNYEALEGTSTDAPYVMVTSKVEPEPDPDPEPAEGQDMFRLYNPYSGEHFYTASAEERDGLVKLGWKDEGVGWKAPAESEVPVYRLYNSYAGDHHYTTSEFELDLLVELGWTDEGVGWYSAGEDGMPVYRQYNPYATVGTHNYTTSEEEAMGLVKLGWRAEGIGWYGL